MATTSPVSIGASPAAAPRIGAAENRVLWLLLAAAFVAILNETTMGVAIPHLVVDLDITTAAAQWLTTAFMLTMAVVIPITGFLLQRFTTRTMFVGAMSLFSLGTLIAFLSPGFPLLIVARVVQASGTAIMMPLLMTTLMTVVPPHARGRMMGRVSVVIAFAPAIGPTLSGFLLDTVGWRWNFGVILPIAILALAVGARWISNVGKTSSAPIDMTSVIFSAFGFGGLVYGLSQIGGVAARGGENADAAAGSIQTTSLIALIVSFAVGVTALVLLVWRQLVLQRTGTPLLDLRVFRSLNFSLSAAQLTVMSVAFFGTITVLPIYLQTAVGLSALQSGLVVLPGALAMGLSGPFVGRIYDRWGTRVLLIPGAVIVTVVLWMLTTLTQSTPVWFLVIAQTLLSLGLAMSFTPLFTASLGSLPPRLYSYGSAVVATLQQVAGAAGVALMVTVLSGVAAAEAATGVDAAAASAAGARAAFTIAAITALPLILGAILIRKPADQVDDGPPPTPGDGPRATTPPARSKVDTPGGRAGARRRNHDGRA